jgi:hypothetical protein
MNVTVSNANTFGKTITAREINGTFCRIDTAIRKAAAYRRGYAMSLNIEDHNLIGSVFYKGNRKCVITSVTQEWSGGIYHAAKVIYEDSGFDFVVISNESSIDPTVEEQLIAFDSFFIPEADYLKN